MRASSTTRYPQWPAGQPHVRLEGGLDELRVGGAPAEPGEHADVSALDEPEAPGAPGDLRELPRQEVAALLAVELVRLGEEQRLAGKVHAVPEHVRRDADVGSAGEEALDLLAPRRERHRAVEDGDAARMQAVHLARRARARPCG